MKGPNLSGYTLEELVERCGELKEERKSLETREKYYVEAIKSRMRTGNRQEVTSTHETFVATFATSERLALDQQRVKEEMGEDWWFAHCKLTEVETLRIKVAATTE